MEILAQEILSFWFGEIAEDGSVAQANAKRWFEKNETFDAKIKRRFEGYLETAVMGAFDRWIQQAEGLTALVVMLDQFPRQIYRNDPKAFAFDAKSLSLSLYGIENELFLKTRSAYGYFLLMPTMHSEDLAVQQLGVKSFQRLLTQAEKGAKTMVASALDFAVKHRDIIERFGRFPHRNSILGRQSSDEELDFLNMPGSSF